MCSTIRLSLAIYAPAEDDDMNVTKQELEEFKYFCLMHKPLESRPMVTVNLSESLLGRKLNCLFNIDISFVSVILHSRLGSLAGRNCGWRIVCTSPN